MCPPPPFQEYPHPSPPPAPSVGVQKICRVLGLVTLSLCCTVLSSLLPALPTVLSLGEGGDRVTLRTSGGGGTFIGSRIHELPSPFEPNDLPRTYYSFKGIPYARAARWRPPSSPPPPSYVAPRMATAFKPNCKVSEDCLYLQIYTPYLPSGENAVNPGGSNGTTTRRSSTTTTTLRPVLVYFHGGEWISGSSELYGPERFMREHVLLVTFNYRLGLLGFMTNGEGSLPGNFGILDQLEALRWIQGNIYRFGGNPLKVTIFGDVAHLLLVQASKDLFTSAIISPVSTSMLLAPSLLGTTSNSPSNIKGFLSQVAKEAGCPKFKKEELLLDCLNKTERASLLRIQNRLLIFFNFPQSPGLSPYFLRSNESSSLFQDEPAALLEEGRYLSALPLLIGTSAYEGFNPFLEFYLKLGSNRSELLKDREAIKERLESTLKLILLGVSSSEPLPRFTRAFNSVWEYYFGGFESSWPEVDTSLVRWKLFRVFGDLTFHSGQRKLSQLLSSRSQGPVYNYIFDSGIEKFQSYLEERTKAWEDERNSSASISTTAPSSSLHSVAIPPWKELYYLFYPLDNPKAPNFTTKQEQSTSESLVRLFVSFAQHGNVSKVFKEWKRADAQGLNYFVLGNSSSSAPGDFRSTESELWFKIILPQIRDLSEELRGEKEKEPFPFLLWIFVGITASLVAISVFLILFLCTGCCRGHKGN